MTTTAKTRITVEATVNAPAEKVWNLWTSPSHITKWNSPSPEWHTPKADHDLKAGGRFTFRMEARDGSMGFDFGGVYDEVKPNQYLEYTMDDGRKAWITFTEKDGKTHVSETFEAENENPEEFQKQGWQAIMDSFRQYAEAN